MSKLDNFEWLVQEIHRVNKGWHTFEIANRFMGLTNQDYRVLESFYLREKNRLQEELQLKHSEKIDVVFDFQVGNPVISIKDDYIFKIDSIKFDNACHTKKES
jgi:hypothetical protein